MGPLAGKLMLGVAVACAGFPEVQKSASVHSKDIQLGFGTRDQDDKAP